MSRSTDCGKEGRRGGGGVEFGLEDQCHSWRKLRSRASAAAHLHVAHARLHRRVGALAKAWRMEHPSQGRLGE
jgi:hypothetical protein